VQAKLKPATTPW